MAKTNSDPRCSRPDDCQSKGGALCRACNLSSLRADPEVRARHAAAMADPEVRARHAAAMKAAMADPEVRARHAAAMADPEVRARITQARLSWCPPEFLDLYRVLVKKVGAKDARVMVEEEVAVISRRTAAPEAPRRGYLDFSVPVNP